MKEKGFTLIELLVTVAIVGVVAALCFPALTKMMPNKEKGLYIKAYKNLTQITADLLNNPGCYQAVYDSDGNVEYEGLSEWDDTMPVTQLDVSGGGQKDAKDSQKYAMLVASRMQLAGKYRYDEKAFNTVDGIEWTFSGGQNRASSTAASPNYKEEITINLAPDSDENQCIYSSTCTKPNQFKFEVDNWGAVKPADALGMVYVRNQTNMSYSSNDDDLAAQVIDKAGSATDVDKMAKALNDLQTAAEKTTTTEK